jgi:hypothetical protein
MKSSLKWFGVVTIVTLSSIVVVAQSQGPSAKPQSVATGKSSLSKGGSYYVTASALNFRKEASLSNEAVIGKLSQNDQVEVLDLLDGSTPLVRVKVVKSQDLSVGAEGFVSADYLRKEIVKVSQGLSKYILIQNVATERARVYERCTASPGCPHRMIFESEMVVGRTEGGMKDPQRYLTWLGRYKITEWRKFYEDGEGHYPSWYHPDYPAVPYNPSNARIWMSKKVMPNKQGHMRGAFGWYTALTGPNSNYQWVHGTMGWGIEADRYIRYTRGFWVNLFANPRSAGCTRFENRAIAYLRHILSVGTEIVRVYAKEGYRDPNRTAYASQAQPMAWEWILTTEGVQQDGPTADRNSVLARGVPTSRILEYGSYNVDRYPDAMGINPNAESRTGKSGNSYEIDESEFHGVFLVDEGRFIDYQHPRGLPRGGFEESQLPEYLRTNGPAVLAKRESQRVKVDMNDTP